MLSCAVLCCKPSVYEKGYLGQTAEERLLDMTRRARIGAAEGEPGVTRVESSISNGVQVLGAWSIGYDMLRKHFGAALLCGWTSRSM